MTLNRRLFLYFFSVFFLVLVVICFFQYQREKEFRTDQLDQQLLTYNSTINRFIVEQNPTWENLEEYVHLFPDTTLRVTVIDTTGVVTFDSSVKKGTNIGNHLQRPEVQMANTEPNGKAIRHSASTGKDYYYLAHRFPKRYVRSALPYNVSLANTLKANTFFIYFMFLVLIIASIALFFISRNFSKSIDRLRIFTKKAENEEFIDTDIEFPKDELGEISKNIVKLYKKQLQTRDDVNNEREKLIKHLQISQEGLGIFSSDKKEILANTNFIQYTNILSDEQCITSDQIFLLPEFDDINQFIDQSLRFNEMKRKKLTVEKKRTCFLYSMYCFSR